MGTSSNEEGGVSVAEAKLDEMIETASKPTLADLFRKAKDAGKINTVVSNYGGNAQAGA